VSRFDRRATKTRGKTGINFGGDWKTITAFCPFPATTCGTGKYSVFYLECCGQEYSRNGPDAALAVARVDIQLRALAHQQPAFDDLVKILRHWVTVETGFSRHIGNGARQCRYTNGYRCSRCEMGVFGQ